MSVPRQQLITATALAFCLAAVLTACGEQGSAVNTPSGEPEPSPTETTPSEPDPMADVLFTITANVRAVDGRTIGISMAAHSPVASTDSAAAGLRDKFVSVCSQSGGTQPIDENYLRDNGSTLMSIDFTSNTPDLTFASPIGLHFGSQYYAHAALGDGITPQPGGQACYYGFDWSKSGTAQGIADFENPDGVPDVSQWIYGFYGFSIDPSSGATIEACRVTLTDLVGNVLDSVQGWDPNLAGDGISCVIGYQGE